ncbi:hypothetical protein LAT59_04885 [Candidatus Gracilibacteria bacterium]|nr:hypothetical protein [Candidatus Gracilibacteria bacterium]
MFSRKLFALFVLIGALGFFVLMYLYFFVYYTTTVVIISNEPNFRGELVSVKNAQNRSFTCPETECILRDIPPFDYRLSLFKDDFESQTLSVSLNPRSTKEIEIVFRREPRLTLESALSPDEAFTIDERDDIYASFMLGEEKGIYFSQQESQNRIVMYYRDNGEDVRLREIERVPISELQAQVIQDSSDIHIRVGTTSFIYDIRASNLIELPFRVPVLYIKLGLSRGVYHVVTEVGSFLYSRQNGNSDFQYLFFDYVVLSDEKIIGIIKPDEEEKRKNFSLPEGKGTLIVLYNSRTREREVLLNTSQNIRQIHKRGDEVYFISGENIRYRLENY